MAEYMRMNMIGYRLHRAWQHMTELSEIFYWNLIIIFLKFPNEFKSLMRDAHSNADFFSYPQEKDLETWKHLHTYAAYLNTFEI